MTTSEEKKELLPWTTWEELLLASAVKRHGVNDWDSVAVELRSRSPLSPLLTAQVCRTKYDDLKRRFDDDVDHRNDDVDDAIPWLEELRKLRVSELRQEVQRYDLSIQSLQSKVKSLEEDRERSLKENENDVGKPDLETNLEERSENHKYDGGAPEEALPEISAGEENRSFNESSSTANRSAGVERRSEPEPDGTSEFEPDPVRSDSKPAGEDSYNDSSDTVAKHAAAAKASQEKKGDDSAGLQNSAGESKEGMKESSDVLSSASLTRSRRREKEVPGGGGGLPVASPATIKREGVKSEPLVGLLDIIRSHKHGSLFERRLKSQKTDDYKKMVRQHMDLETIRTRVQNGSSSSSTTKFHRDLLLLFNNAVVFFPQASVESVAAYELRDLVSKEIKKEKKRSDNSSDPDPKPDPERTDSFKPSGPILVCRKRSSISAKASNSIKRIDEKPNISPNLLKNSLNLKEERSPKTEEMPVTGARSLRRNKNSKTTTHSNDSADKGENLKVDKKKTTEVIGKKRGAADFLKRIKRNSPLKVNLLERGGGREDNNGGRREKKKGGDGGRREAPAAKSGGGGRGGGGGGKQVEEESSPSKRGVGRPRKRGAEGGGRKRGREGGGVAAAAAAAGSKQVRKRSRR